MKTASLIATSVFVFACVLWGFPKIVTGDYATITVDSIETHSNGQVDFRLSYLASAGSRLCEEFYIDNSYVGGGSGSGGSFPARPSKGSSASTFNLCPEILTIEGAHSESYIDQRLLVKAGSSYTIHPGQPLVLCDFASSSGKRHLGRVSIYRE